jgi:putative tricarboxylic transport membrane protein
MDKRDIYSSVVWFTISGFAFFSSLRLGVGGFHNPGPGFLPFWASIFLVFFTIIMLINSFLSKKNPPKMADHWKDLEWSKVVTIIIALVLYILIMPKTGYLIATFGLMIILFRIGNLKLLGVLSWSLFSVLTSYYLFYTLLKVPLPRGLLSF